MSTTKEYKDYILDQLSILNDLEGYMMIDYLLKK